jgi:hypothetical protein
MEISCSLCIQFKDCSAENWKTNSVTERILLDLKFLMLSEKSGTFSSNINAVLNMKIKITIQFFQ